jgi:hypothetical protein
LNPFCGSRSIYTNNWIFVASCRATGLEKILSL